MNQIKERREALHLSQEALAKLAKVQQKHISNIETGKNCELKTLLKVLSALNGTIIFKWKRATKVRTLKKKPDKNPK